MVPNAADSNYLDGSIPEFVPIQQRLESRGERVAVAGKCRQYDLMDLPGSMVLRVKDGGKLILDNGHSPGEFHKLRKECLAPAFTSFLFDALNDPVAYIGFFDASQ